eukprot:CAMPEP_0173408140 /NCGR_PEP_ID=MMETSP1356-20130122/68931_1 /TAXON_ID=77927 ORGANISM="Hemiselmis virescens, Strain PCC157" /NCGR_SAMPLE_ID=MMETSP1356 /ASSEMBLY_ACC=CAM_ASM_000847 /LENGTH=118 /DNA_ID=CAMNT_0014369395 /DNA_START=34 /DNA_END=386 /DNA_ORIENTATION=-
MNLSAATAPREAETQGEYADTTEMWNLVTLLCNGDEGAKDSLDIRLRAYPPTAETAAMSQAVKRVSLLLDSLQRERNDVMGLVHAVREAESRETQARSEAQQEVARVRFELNVVQEQV